MSAPSAYRARWVFPVDGPPIEDGVAVVDDDRILDVGSASLLQRFDGETIDLADVALLPGLVNAHTHLDLSDCPAPLGKPGMSFPDWARCVLSTRGAEGRPERSEIIRAGIDESLSAGVTTIGDITTSGWSPQDYERSEANGVIFHELIGFFADDTQLRLAEAREALSTRVERWSVGLSPHAPYSVHRETLNELLRLAAAEARRVAIHLAESPEEIELLRSGTGAFRDLLEERSVWDPSPAARASTPGEYLDDLVNTGAPALVVHGNFLMHHEIEVMAAHARTLSLVYCPRTHARFGYPPHPAPKLVAAGGRVAVGTDSRATNPDLSLLDELRFVARHVQAIPEEEILAMGTLRAAEALGLERNVGSLTAGKQANMTAIPLGGRTSKNPYELLFDNDAPPARTMVAGRWVRG